MPATIWTERGAALHLRNIAFLQWAAFGWALVCSACLGPLQPEVNVKVQEKEAQIRDLVRPPLSVKSKPIPGFMRGLNLGNALDAPNEGEWGVVLTKRHFKLAAEAGFDHVRLPVRFSAHAERTPPYTIDEKFFQRVDWAVGEALRNGLSVIVDFHHYEEIMESPDMHRERFLAIWRQIALRYKDKPQTVAFELLNEPCKNLNPTKLNMIVRPSVEAIRASNPNRLIFVDSYFWAAPKHLSDLDLAFADNNVIATFHMYQPVLFAFQAAPWMEPEYQTRNVVFPGPPPQPVAPKGKAAEVEWVSLWFKAYNTLPESENPGGPKAVFDEFNIATQFVKKTGRRIYLGEFGAIDNADAASRARFVHLVRTEAERRGMGWAYWDDGGQFKLLTPRAGKWISWLKRALLD
jgi:endoglucanase